MLDNSPTIAEEARLATRKRGRPSKFTPEQTNEIVVKSFQEGTTVKDLAKEYGCSTTTIRNVIKRQTVVGTL